MKKLSLIILMLFLPGNSFPEDYLEVIEGPLEKSKETTENCLLRRQAICGELMKTNTWKWYDVNHNKKNLISIEQTE